MRLSSLKKGDAGVDVTGDGNIDAFAYDTSGDGQVDTLRALPNEIGSSTAGRI